MVTKTTWRCGIPTYDYRCSACKSDHEEFHGIHLTPNVRCPKCGARCKKLIGGGAGVIFKGSGFYQTDYCKTDEGKRAADRLAEADPNAPALDQD